MNRIRSEFKHYLVAVFSVAIALILTLMVENLVDRSLIGLFLAAVAITAWYGGIKPGIVAVVLSFIACNYYVFSPVDSITTGTPASLVRNAQLVLVTSAICYLTGQLRLSTQRLTRANQALEGEIQERIEAEAALKASEAELRALFSAIPDPLFVINAEGQILSTVFIESDNQKVNHTLDEIFEPPQANIYLNYVQQALQSQQSVSVEYSLMLEGQETWFAARIAPISADTVIWLARDISDRKRAEAASILEERNRMAREIHDTLAQAFTGILVQVGAATQVLTDDVEATQAHLDLIDELARTGLTEARRSVAALRPQLLEKGNLHSALHRLVTQMRAATDTALIYEIKGTAYPLATEVENNLLRMGQEALTNAIKYAAADKIWIELMYGNAQCILRVKDNGRGFGLGSIPSGGGFGLLGMSERAENIGAQLTIQSQPGQGTEIVVVVNRA